MKKCLPDTTKVSKDAKECVQECTSEFISFITSEAAERCAIEKRKTINGEDILFAMSTLGFDMYAEVLKVYLVKYRVRLPSVFVGNSQAVQLTHSRPEYAGEPARIGKECPTARSPRRRCRRRESQGQGGRRRG